MCKTSCCYGVKKRFAHRVVCLGSVSNIGATSGVKFGWRRWAWQSTESWSDLLRISSCGAITPTPAALCILPGKW